MADVHNGCDSPGFKLFGKTIKVQAIKDIKDEQNKADHDNKEEALLEKIPDKIIPCPRCKSMETKFCYFNNYNVNQPRHFCKGCQRYWTAGGSLRNVPVGAGRRKIKPPILCRELSGTFSDNSSFDDDDHTAGIQFDGVVEEWHVAANGGFQHVFPAKRRRSTSSGQSC